MNTLAFALLAFSLTEAVVDDFRYADAAAAASVWSVTPPAARGIPRLALLADHRRGRPPHDEGEEAATGVEDLGGRVWDLSACRDSVAQDWPEWIKAGLLDFVCPMDYTENDPRSPRWSRTRCSWWAGRTPIYPSIGVTRLAFRICRPTAWRGKFHHVCGSAAAGFTIFNFSPDVAEVILPGVGAGAWLATSEACKAWGDGRGRGRSSVKSLNQLPGVHTLQDVFAMADPVGRAREFRHQRIETGGAFRCGTTGVSKKLRPCLLSPAAITFWHPRTMPCRTDAGQSTKSVSSAAPPAGASSRPLKWILPSVVLSNLA